MPSRSEGFGLVALEALSAGLPILVGSKSGFARSLENIPYGKSWIVNSDDPKLKVSVPVMQCGLKRSNFRELLMTTSTVGRNNVKPLWK